MGFRTYMPGGHRLLIPGGPYDVFATLDGSATRFRDTTPAGIDHTTDYSISAWVKTTSVAQKYILHKDGANDYGFTVLMNASGNLYCIMYVNDGSHGQYMTATSTGTINDGAWHHVGVTYDEAPAPVLTLYIDGSPDGTDVTAAGVHDSGAGILYIGGFFGSVSTWDGAISDVAVWTSLLSAANMATLAANPGVESLSPDSWWLFDDAAAATTIADQATAGNGNHLALRGGDATDYSTHSRAVGSGPV